MSGDEARQFIRKQRETKLDNYAKELKNTKVFFATLSKLLEFLETMRIDKVLLTNDNIKTVFECLSDATSAEKFIIVKITLSCLLTTKKHFIIANHLECVVSLGIFCANDKSADNVFNGVSLLTLLLEVDEDISEKVLQLGGLNSIIGNCSSNDYRVLQKCALAIFKSVLYGGKECENHLLKIDSLQRWFIPLLNIYENKSIKYFAYLTVVYLRAFSVNGHVPEILRNGILDDVISWISDDNTQSFLLTNASLETDDEIRDLKKVLPLLMEGSKMAQILGAFLFYRVAYDDAHKARRIFHEIGAVKALARIALISNETTRKFASLALTRIGEQTPEQIPNDLSIWSQLDFKTWLTVINLSDYYEYFETFDNEKFFKLKDRDLKENCFMSAADKRKLFFEEREYLRVMTRSSTGWDMPLIKLQKSISGFSRRSCKRFSNYKPEAIEIVQNGNSVYKSTENIPEIKSESNAVAVSVEIPVTLKKTLDVFISYRRAGGSELASLLNVRLQLKNYKVFFDVESLRSGHFGKNLIESVKRSRNFLLILSPNALDRCVEDSEHNDWVRKEIAMAMESKCNIIPITKDFDNSIFLREGLPDVIRDLRKFNQITWHHDTQSECFDKVERYASTN